MISTLPENLTLLGKVIADRRHSIARTAPAAGTLVSLIVPSGAVARKGDPIVQITGPVYIDAQVDLIAGLQNKFKVKPTSLEDKSAMIQLLHSRLEALKFSRRQIEQIRNLKTVFNPVPLLMPQDGIVWHETAVGCAFQTDQSLFRFSPGSVISASIAAEHAAYLRSKKQCSVTFGDGVIRTGFIKSISSDIQGGSREITIEVSEIFYPINEQVTCSIAFAAWERVHPECTSSHWPYPTLPRGSAYFDLMKTFGVTVARSSITKTARAPARTPNPNPFAPGNQISRRPKRADPQPHNLHLLALPQQVPARPSLPQGDQEFFARRISTYRASRRDAIFPCRLSAKVTFVEANQATVSVPAPLPGDFEPAIIRRFDLVRTGTPIGYVLTDQCSDPAITKSTAPVQQTRTAVYAARDGILLEEVIPLQNIKSGDSLAVLRPINMYRLKASLPVQEFDRLPRIVEARLLKPLSDQPIYINQNTIITEHSRTADKVLVDIRLPVDAGQFNTGFIKDIALVDPTEHRNILLIPNDCVTRIGKSTEVLVHSEIGKLTPIPVRCGLRYSDDVEILDGLKDGHWVVRDLGLLCEEYTDFRAIMAGFWNIAA